MNSDSSPVVLDDAAGPEYHARWEAVETFKARELTAMTEERARQINRSLRQFTEPWRYPCNAMGLAEQQAIFHKCKAA